MSSSRGRVLGFAAIAALALAELASTPVLASRAPAHLVSATIASQAGVTPQLRWTNQFGTSGADEAEAVAVDDLGNSFVVGYTAGALPGQTSQGGYDAYVRSYDFTGAERWTTQFGTSADDVAFAVAVDGNGNIYVSGYTSGTLSGQTSSGGMDAFVRSYDSHGNERWTSEFGSPKVDVAQSIATDVYGNVFVSGYSLDVHSGDEDGWVRSFAAASGNPGWTISIASPFFDDARSVAVDAQGHVIVGGAYASSAFVGFYSQDGSALWTDSFAGAVVNGVAPAFGGGVVAVGTAGGALPGSAALGGSDAFVRAYSALGDRAWTRQFGSPLDDAADAVAVNLSGDIVIAGSTAGALPGQTSSGGSDAFVTAYHPDGSPSWTVQFGTGATDLAFGVAVDGAGNVIVAGPTSGALPGQTSIGGSDAYVRSYGACQIIVRVDSSWSLMPVLGSAQLGFQALAANAACTVSVLSGTTPQAIAALQAGTINAAAISRPLTSTEKSTLYGWQIGGDAMVIAVQNSPAMSFISNITSAQVQGIYSGTITNWSALGGPDQPIAARSGAIDAEDRADLLRLFKVTDSAEQTTISGTGLGRLGSAYDEAAAAAGNPYQIVYTSLADATMAGLKPLKLDGVAPNVYNVQNSTYPATRAFYIAMRKNSFTGAGLTDWPTVKAEDLVNFMLTSAGQQSLAQNGFVQTVVPAGQPIPDRDTNLDGAIGLGDVAGLLSHWGQTSTCQGWIRADVNNDGAVGLGDIGPILSHWASKGFVRPN
jgi:ABC-type phosphate transport system substrate-binding protein